jgi:F0F1-type ATP synthase membrane subunit b/b'
VDGSQLTGDLLNGPYGFLVAIAAFAWLATKEYRKARAEDVAEARADADAEQQRRTAAEAERDAVRDEAEETRRRLERKIDEVRTEVQAPYERVLSRLTKAREMLIEHGVPTEELP